MDHPGRLALTFCTGVGTVTGANFLLETPGGARVLVDCGLVQGERVAEEQNYAPFGYDPRSITALLVTHAHLDHVGRIPKLVKEGFSGPIYSTPETRSLAELVLNDSAGLIGKEAAREGRDPLYDIADIQPALALWKTVPYHQTFKVADADGVTASFADAGHILGSAMIRVVAGGKTIVFTGDVGNSPAPLLRDTEPIGETDYVVIESVYGDRTHEPHEEREAKLVKAVQDALARGGTLVIPAFSLDRTQVILYELNDMVEQGKIPSVPIFVDTPMGTRATEIYRASTELFNDRIREQIRRGDDIFRFPRLEYTATQQDSRAIDHIKGAKIILAGSGMSVGGRVISHEERYLPDPRSTILLVGYQAVGSLGRALAEGAKKVRIYGRDVEVKAKIETMYGFSAHKDGDHLVELVSTATDEAGKAKPKQVFVAMGEPKASMHLAQRLNNELGVKAMMPERMRAYEL